MDLRWFVTVFPNAADFQVKVIKLSNQGIHSPDWEMFRMDSMWTEICHTVARCCEFSSQENIHQGIHSPYWEMF